MKREAAYSRPLYAQPTQRASDVEKEQLMTASQFRASITRAHEQLD